MKLNEDARVRKTKARLISTFRKLLTEKSFEEITINEICEISSIRRATFYKHFSDKYAFLKYFVGSLRKQFDAKLEKRAKTESTSAYYVEYLRALVDFLTENERMVKNALESSALPALLEVIKERNYEDTCEKLRESVRGGLKLSASIDVTAAMMTGAVAETIIRWFRGGKKIPKESLIQEASAIILKISNLD